MKFLLLLSAVDEKFYTRKKLRKGRFSLRFLFLISAILYGAFGYLDFLLAGDFLPTFLFIRFGVVIPLLLVLVTFTYHKTFHQWSQRILLTSFIVAGTGASSMLILLPDALSYYGGMFMICFGGYFLLKLNTSYAIVGGITNLALFIGGYAIFHGEIPFNIWLVALILLGANIIGAVGNIQLERNGRIVYRQEREIREKNRQLEAKVHQQHKELVQVEKAIESTSEAIAIYSPEGKLTYANQAYGKLMAAADVFADSAYTNGESLFQIAIEQGSWSGEQTITKKNGKAIVMLIQADVVQEANGEVIGLVTIYRDITERKEAENEIEYLSFHDVLTGLYNRRFFDEELKRLDIPRNLPLTLMMLDVNGLKLTNDAFGHRAGDKLLTRVASLLQNVCRDDDIIARIGGDEFAILLPQLNDEEAQQLTKRIQTAISLAQVEVIPLSVSCGWGTKTDPQESITDVFKMAEDYMYRHKISDRGSYRHQTIQLIMQTLYTKSPREQQHSKRVSQLCGEIGTAMGLEINELTTAGMLHDIGKVAISESILDKASPITDSEWTELKRHPEAGYSILCSVNDYGPLAECVLAHHERWDGAGYPNGLKGEAIPLLARIIAIADSYDAMVSTRPYRKGLSHADAMKEIEACAGFQFDPAVAKVFIGMMQERKANDGDSEALYQRSK